MILERKAEFEKLPTAWGMVAAIFSVVAGSVPATLLAVSALVLACVPWGDLSCLKKPDVVPRGVVGGVRSLFRRFVIPKVH